MSEDSNEVNEKRNREKVLGFAPQKEHFYNFYLPYREFIDQESKEMLDYIKQELGRSLAMREITPGLGIIISRLLTFMKLYGLKFSKEDHIKLVKVLLKIIEIPNLPPSKLNKCCTCICKLLCKSKLLSPNDLQIEWRPLLKLARIYVDKRNSKGENIRYFSTLEQNLSFTIQLCAPYFPPGSGKEILDELLPTMEPLDIGKTESVIELLTSFLTHDSYELWFSKFINLLDSYKYSKYSWWTAAIMNLIASTAANTIGLIDWNRDDLIPKMFTRILRSLDLPVCYKQMKSLRDQSLYADSSAQFIVSLLGPKTNAFKYLENLMATIETYLHPANKGKWTRTVSELLMQLVKYFHERVVSERYKIHPWKRPTPDDYKLRDEDITQFVLCVKPSAMQVMYSRGSDAGELLKLLADLKPDLILPDIIERVFETVDSSTEPHKYTAVLQVLPYISHLMATGSHTVSKTQIIPLLFAVLPGIDLNDNRKTILTLQFVMLQSISITFIDCSKASLYHELSEEESLICEQTAQLEDFILQFLDRVFHLIENTGAETTRMEHSSHVETIRTRLESLNETLIRSTMQSILSQCSQDILNSATKKLVNYIESGTILESKIAAPTMAAVCSAFASLNGPSLYKSLLPYLMNQIQQHFEQSDDIFESEKQNDELFYLLTLLTIIKDDPIAIQSYTDELISIFDLLFKCKCKMTGKATIKLISNLLIGLSTISTKNVKTTPDAFKKSLEEYLPIRDWGMGMQRDEKINFFLPGIEEMKQCEKVIHYYLPPILEKLEKFSCNELDLTKDQLDLYLRFLHGILLSNNFLENWDDEEVKVVETVINTRALKLRNGYEGLSIKMPNGENIRKTIYECLHKLQKKILLTKEDDFNSIIQLMNVYEKLHCFSHRNQSSDNQTKIVQKTKVFQQNKLCKKKKDIPNIISTRTMIQHDYRIEMSTPQFTKTHYRLMLDLLELSTSQYSVVRSSAQSKLFKMFSIYAFAYRSIIDNISALLSIDPNENHETFKGALYLIGTNRKHRLITRPDWVIIEKLWINLLKTKLSEKLSILKLMETILNSLNTEFITIATELEISDEIAKLGEEIMIDKSKLPENFMHLGLELVKKSNDFNREKYLQIIKSIIEYSRSNNLHWRYRVLANSMINVLLHPVTNYPCEVIQFSVNNLINDSIQDRVLSLRIVNSVFRQQKREHLKITLNPFELSGVKEICNSEIFDGFRDDNKWLQYEKENIPKNQSEWDKPAMFKANGFFGWSPGKLIEVYAPNVQQPKLDRKRDELNDHEKIIYDFFSDSENVNKLIEFWSLEEKKGKEKFNRTRFTLIRRLFGCFGLQFLDSFLPHLTKLIENKSSESSHRCASEILAGIIRGAKHWDFQMTLELIKNLDPIIRLSLNNLTNETESLWGTAYATAAENMDPMKQHYLYEILLENPIRGEQTSSSSCSRLYCLIGAFNQHVWRMNSVSIRLLEYLEPFLSHEFQNIRQRISTTLINIFENDICLPKSELNLAPKIKNLIESRRNDFSLLFESDINQVVQPVDQQLAIAQRNFKTIAHFIGLVIEIGTNGNEAIYFELLPLVARFEKISEGDIEDDFFDVSTSLFAMMAQALTLPKDMNICLEKIEQVSNSPLWSIRLASLNFLQVQVFTNMPTVISKIEWVEKVTKIVLRLIEDKVLEVREKAAELLTDLIHCSFIPSQNEIILLMKKKCKTKIPKKTENDFDQELAKKVIIQRHSGVLGCCSFILSQPYTIPDYVPPLFEILSNHLNDPHPIPASIRKTIANFKRTHHDGWELHKSKFSENQLAVISELTVPPSYYS